jgi:hypothetical protein
MSAAISHSSRRGDLRALRSHRRPPRARKSSRQHGEHPRAQHLAEHRREKSKKADHGKRAYAREQRAIGLDRALALNPTNAPINKAIAAF